MKFSRLAVAAVLWALADFPLAGQSPSERLPRSSPEEQGISAAAILAYVDEADATVHSMNSFMLVRHGQVVAEGWWAPYAANEPHVMCSLSKSFTSTATGLAESEGKLSIYDPIAGIFPPQLPASLGANLRALRLRDLLSMSSGQDEDDIKPFPFDSSEDLVKNFLARPFPHKPGTRFVYNTPGTYMVSAAVQKATGQSVPDYQLPRLFGPLGIGDPRWDASAPIGASGAWTTDSRYTALVCRYRTPIVTTYQLEFTANTVDLMVQASADLNGDPPAHRLAGKAEL